MDVEAEIVFFDLVEPAILERVGADDDHAIGFPLHFVPREFGHGAQCLAESLLEEPTNSQLIPREVERSDLDWVKDAQWSGLSYGPISCSIRYRSSSDMISSPLGSRSSKKPLKLSSL